MKDKKKNMVLLRMRDTKENDIFDFESSFCRTTSQK